jgi:hypothetical protein
MPVADLTPLDMSLAAAAGVAIAAACGLRAFLPLLALALGVHFQLLHVHPSAAWIGSMPAILTLVWATLLELAADKVPALDHALDVVALGLRPAAAALAAWATFAGAHPALAVAAAAILGAGAMGVQIAKAKVRLGSSMLTLGTANPLISFAEDAITLVISSLAVLAPILALVTVLFVFWAVRRAFRPRPVLP